MDSEDSDQTGQTLCRFCHVEAHFGTVRAKSTSPLKRDLMAFGAHLYSLTEK